MMITQREFLIRFLYKKENINASHIISNFYENHSDYVDVRRERFLKKGLNLTEKDLKNRLGAELRREMTTLTRKFEAFQTNKTKGKLTIYSLSPEGEKFYEDNFLEDKHEIETNIITTDEDEDENNDIGFVYLFYSTLYPNVYKIGRTFRDVTERCEELKTNKTYGSYNLEPLMYIKTDRMSIIEIVLHKFFEEQRICKKNNICINTELFKDINIEDFKTICQCIVNSNTYKNTSMHII